MDPEHGDAELPVEGVNGDDAMSPGSDQDPSMSASYWEGVNQEEIERERREREQTGKITEGELPETGSARRAKEMFETQPEEQEKETPVDLQILSGVTKASMKKYQETQASRTSQQREVEDLGEIQGGIAASNREAFERGKASNVERKKEDEEEEHLPTAGIASKTRASIESGQVIRAEDRHVRETEIIDDMPSAGAASAVRRRFEKKNDDEGKSERRLSYEPEKGEAKARTAMYMQSVEVSSRKNLSQDEEDALPPAGSTSGVRQMFEQNKAIHAESNLQDSWKESLPPSGAAQASKEALKAAAAKGYQKSQVEDEALSPGVASATRSRYEKGEFDDQKVVEREEPIVSPGSTKEQMKHYQEEVAQNQTPRRRTMDSEREELEAARGVALAVKSSYEKEGAPHKEIKRTISDEDFTGIQGRAKETTREIESGGLIKQAPKMVETEDFGVIQGVAKQTTRQIEKGELIKETPKMVDEEDFSGVSGRAKQTTQQIEKGELIKEAHKMVEDEDFSGISGVVKGTRERIDSGEMVTEAPVRNSDKGDLMGIQSVSSNRAVFDQNGLESNAVHVEPDA